MASPPIIPPASFPDQPAPEKKYLQQQVRNLRVVELKELLLFGEKNQRYGARDILMERCLSMVEDELTPELAAKINDLHYKRNGCRKPTSTQPPLIDANPTDSNVGANGTEVCVPSCMPVSSKDISTVNTLGLESGPSMGGELRLHRALDLKTPLIKMANLPFYEVKNSLLGPFVLVNQKENESATKLAYCQKSFPIPLLNYSELLKSFCTEQSLRARNLPTSASLQLQLRFCAIEPLPITDESYELADMLPKGLLVKVNGISVGLPNFARRTSRSEEPRRLPLPIDITHATLRRCNAARPEISITVEWKEDESGPAYAMSVYIVQKLTAYDLFKKLRYQPPQDTIEQLRRITSATEDGVSPPTFVSVSLMCPLVKTRMNFPCRAITCSHLQCFDAENFLRMNEVKTKFKCPVCNLNLKFEDLRMDTYIVDALSSCPAAEVIQLCPNGGLKTVKESGKIETETAANAVIPQRKGMSGIPLTPASVPRRNILCIDLEERNYSNSSLSIPATAHRTSNGSGTSVRPPVPVIDISDLDEDVADTTQN